MKISLDMLKKGDKGVIYSVNLDNDFKIRLLDLGIIPGVEITMIRQAPFGDPMQFRILGYYISIRKETACHIEVLR